MFGLRLDANAIRPLHIPADNRPDHATGEDQAGEITDERETLICAAMQELERLGHLVVDLGHRGHTEQHEEAEVDRRVHRTGSRVAQQGLHVDAGAEVLQPLFALAAVVDRLSGPPRSQLRIRCEKFQAP